MDQNTSKISRGGIFNYETNNSPSTSRGGYANYLFLFRLGEGNLNNLIVPQKHHAGYFISNFNSSGRRLVAP